MMKLFAIAFLCAISFNVGSANNCDVIPIESWSGTPLNRIEKLSLPVNLVVIQHTVTNECMTDEDCENRLNAVRANLINSGFRDIGISFLVGGNGRVYEGSGWKLGAHTVGFNNRSISISFIGDFREKLPTSIALRSAQRFLGCQVNKNLGQNYNLVGHMQLASTLSPGAALQQLIETWPHWTGETTNL